jgi:Mg-chelatase subunit ChlD
MSFLVAAALFVGLLVALPALAHLLRRGRAREQPFPPAALVRAARTVARRERKLEDRALLALRALAVLLLAVLGASPLVRCSRLSLARGAGASLAVALVVDDSLSMRAAPDGGNSRFERAVDAGEQLLDSVREGDSVAIILAGRPARLGLGPTTDLGLARKTLRDLSVSDRATDLGGAVALAQGALADSERRERRVIVLSDFAAPALPAGGPPLWAPVPELAQAAPDCAVTSAERQSDRVVATLACSHANAARGRHLETLPLHASGLDPSGKSATAPGRDPVPPARAELEARAGTQTVSLAVPVSEQLLAVRLTGTDALAHDDVAAVAPATAALGVAVLADTERSGSVTGGPTLVEQAFHALERDIKLRPLGVLPDQGSELDPYALVLLDDPAGLTPEARSALSGWIERGGTAVALLGPRAETTKLGSPLEPFALGPVRWEKKPAARGAKVASFGWLGPEASGLGELAPEGRALVDAGRVPGGRVLATWSDGAPFLVERDLGRGRVITLALPSSASESDFALRPGFVALLDHLLQLAKQGRGLARSEAGSVWKFGSARPVILGPEGPLELRESSNEGRIATPSVRGLYRVTGERGEELRSVTLEPEEVTSGSHPPATAGNGASGTATSRLVDVSGEAGLLLALLLACELVFRVFRFVRG